MGPSLPPLPVSQLNDFPFISKTKKRERDENVRGLKHRFIQQVFIEHLPWTKFSTLSSQESVVHWSEATRVPSMDLGTEVQAGFPRYEWGCI